MIRPLLALALFAASPVLAADVQVSLSGSIATILVLVRVISIPDSFFFAGRGIGIWISLACAVGIILAGLLEASEEM